MTRELRRTIPIALPLILSNMTQLSLGLIDSAMVGAIDYFQLAASSLVVNAIAIPQVIGTGITMAVSPLVAFSNGRKDYHRVSHLLYNGFWVASTAGLLIALSIMFSKDLLLHLHQDEKVAHFAVPYFMVMGISLFPMMIFLHLKQFSDGLEYTQTGMVLSIAALPVNALLCWFFIFGKMGFPRMELVGAGVATLITRSLQALAMMFVIYRHRIFRPFIALKHQTWNLNMQTVRDLLHIGIPSSLQYTMEAGAFSISGVMIGWLGATVQAAHQIALNFASFTFMGAMGLSLAASIRISNAHGKNDRILLRNIGTSTIAGAVTYGVLCGFLFIVFKNHLPYLFNNNERVVAIAANLMIYGALFQISDATQSTGVGLLRGLKDVKRPTLYVAIAYWVIGVPLGYWLAFTLKIGAAGIWLGFLAGLTTSSLLLNARFLKMTKTG